jgi:hypothetical protein
MFCYEVDLYEFALLIHIHRDLQLHQPSGAVASMSDQHTNDSSLGARALLTEDNLSELDFEVKVAIIASRLAPTWYKSLRAAKDATDRTVGLMQSANATDEQRQAVRKFEVESYQTQELHRTLLWAAMECLDVTDADPSVVSTAFFRVLS